jgi:hypothetical protein
MLSELSTNTSMHEYRERNNKNKKGKKIKINDTVSPVRFPVNVIEAHRDSKHERSRCSRDAPDSANEGERETERKPQTLNRVRI